MAFNILDGFSHIQQQGELGRQRGQENRLASLSQQAYGATGADRTSALGQMEGVRPGAGLAIGDKLQSNDDAKAKRYGGAARYLLSAIESKNDAAMQGAYMATRPAWEELAQGKPLPDQFDPQMLPMLHQIIAASEGAGGGAGDGVQSTYVDGQGQRVAIMRDGSQKVLGANDAGMQGQTITVTGDDGKPRQMTFNKRTMTYEPAQMGGQPQGQPMPQQQRAAGEVPFSIDPSLPPEVQAAIRANEQQFANAHEGSNIQVSQQVPQSYGQPQRAPQPGGDPFTGRAPEQQAALTTGAQEQAKIDAYLLNSGMVGAADANAAGQKAEAEARAKAGVEQGVRGQVRGEGLRAELPALKASQRSLLDAYRGLQEGRYTSGLIVGMVPDRWQSEANQQLATTINEEILAVAERMKGTLSDKDVAFLRSATFGLDKKPQANMNIIGRKLQIINDAIKRGEGGEQGAAPSGGGTVWKRVNGKLVRGN